MKNLALLTMENLAAQRNEEINLPAALEKLGWAAKFVPWTNTREDWSRFDLVIIRSTWDYSMYPTRFLQQLECISNSGAWLVNPLDMVRWNIHKSYLMNLQQQGVPVVSGVDLAELSNEAIQRVFEKLRVKKIVIKPYIGASSKNVFYLEYNGQLNWQLPNYIDRKADYFAQEFVESIYTSGEYSLVFFNGVYSHCVVKKPGNGDFRVHEKYGAVIELMNPPEKLRGKATEVLHVLSATPLYARIDMMESSDGEYVLSELELMEPSLFLRMDPEFDTRFANAINSYYG